MKRRLYWAYGSNLNIDHMLRRCPDAKPYQALSTDGALVFRGVADVVYVKNNLVHGGLWYISKADERELDRYEGVASRLYEKRYLRMTINGGEPQYCLFYRMKMSGFYPPTDAYLDCIAQGYRDFGLPIEALDRAVARSHAKKTPTQYFITRHNRRGGGPLARNVKSSNKRRTK